MNPLDELVLEGAIAHMFPHARGRLDIRPLWCRDGVCHCRLNWWRERPTGEAYIAFSAYAVLRETAESYTVNEVTVRRVA